MNSSPPEVFISADDPSCAAQAQRIAAEFGLPLLATPSEPGVWRLQVSSEGLLLLRPDGLSTQINFVSGKARQRSQEANFKSQPLARALGLQKLRKKINTQPDIIDATAGFGTDGWMMACLDTHVRLLEASPVLCAMLSHAVNVANADIKVINTDSVAYLRDKNHAPADIVYLDPMYPATRSKALVKKGMQLLHELIGPDHNSETLLHAALDKANYRVVVKRPKGAEQFAGSESFTGQITSVQSAHTRFDIYHLS